MAAAGMGAPGQLTDEAAVAALTFTKALESPSTPPAVLAVQGAA